MFLMLWSPLTCFNSATILQFNMAVTREKPFDCHKLYPLNKKDQESNWEGNRPLNRAAVREVTLWRGILRRSRQTPRQRTYQVDRNTKIIEIVFHYYQTPFKALISTYEGDPGQGGGGKYPSLQDKWQDKTSSESRSPSSLMGSWWKIVQERMKRCLFVIIHRRCFLTV